MKIYIAGKITDNPNFKEEFAEAEKTIKAEGHTVMNPAILPPGFEHHEYMEICYSMINICDAIALLPNWEDSKGAKMEEAYAKLNTKQIYFYNPMEQTLKSSLDCKGDCTECGIYGERCCRECEDKYKCPIKCQFLKNELGEPHLYEDK
ncbi:MAG: hypothetical protein K0R80_132 [Clostridia bacterium]|jgi:hypothetical protein|nr:hypothetical protein [Clostridia bacterium]